MPFLPYLVRLSSLVCLGSVWFDSGFLGLLRRDQKGDQGSSLWAIKNRYKCSGGELIV